MLNKKCLFGGLWLGSAVAVFAAVISVAIADELEDKRNELNQIYWRIVANNRLNDTNLGKDYSWIQDEEYYESIIKIIGEAIGDCVTGANEFAKPTEDGLIVFEASPEDYQGEHWNAVLLYNYIKDKRDEVYKKYKGYVRPEYDKCKFAALQKKLYAHYEKNYQADKNELWKLLDESRNDIQQYNDALGLEKILEDFFSTAKEYDEKDTQRGTRRQKLNKLRSIKEYYNDAKEALDWLDGMQKSWQSRKGRQGSPEDISRQNVWKACDASKSMSKIIASEYLAKDINAQISKRPEIQKDLDEASAKFNLIKNKLQDNLDASCDEIDTCNDDDIKENLEKAKNKAWNEVFEEAPIRRISSELRANGKTDLIYDKVDTSVRKNFNYTYPMVAPGLYAEKLGNAENYPWSKKPKNERQALLYEDMTMPNKELKYTVQFIIHDNELKLHKIICFISHTGAPQGELWNPDGTDKIEYKSASSYVEYPSYTNRYNYSTKNSDHNEYSKYVLKLLDGLVTD